MQEELTPEQIAEGSEVMARYDGFEYDAIADIDDSDCGGIYERCKVFSKIPIEINAYPDIDQYYVKNGWFLKANENGGYLINPNYLDWNALHEVWDKLQNEDNWTNIPMKKQVELTNCFSWESKQQTFTTLVEAVKWLEGVKK